MHGRGSKNNKLTDGLWRVNEPIYAGVGMIRQLTLQEVNVTVVIVGWEICCEENGMGNKPGGKWVFSAKLFCLSTQPKEVLRATIASPIKRT